MLVHIRITWSYIPEGGNIRQKPFSTKVAELDELNILSYAFWIKIIYIERL
jgi:hypothetical protein